MALIRVALFRNSRGSKLKGMNKKMVRREVAFSEAVFDKENRKKNL